MTDYQVFINALRKCVKEHENDITPTGHIVVSALCKDTANLLEALEQEPTTKNDLGVDVLDKIRAEIMELDYIDEDKYEGTSIDPQISRDDVLEIVDKYKAESEDI